MKPSRDIERLIEIMAALRTPGTGCPWDLEQDFASIAPYTIEEAHEVADAIARGDLVDLKDELGDLLLQVAFHARMAEEAGAFAFPDVVEAITGKLIRRHPHVFGDARNLSPAEVKQLWGQIKAQERADKAAARQAAGLPAPAEEQSVLPIALLVAKALRHDDDGAVLRHALSRDARQLLAQMVRKIGRRRIEAQLDRRGDLVDVLPARPRGAHEALLDQALVDRNGRCHLNHGRTVAQPKENCSVEARSRYRPPDRDHGRPAHAGNRLPLGSRTGLRLDRSLYDRGGP